MEEQLESNIGHRNKFHLAGIVPIACQPLGFNLPWHESLMPIAPNYLAFERAIYECAVAGCETIWIVSHRETTPLLRHRLGDWVYDPVINPSLKSKYVDRPSEHLKQIPLYYVPIGTKDRGVRDGLVWSIFYGIRKAYHISQYFSKWVTPNRYYVAFPYSTYNALDIRPHRVDISSGKPFFIQTPEGKTVKDGALTGFTISPEEYSSYLKNFRDHENILWKNGEWKDGKFVGEKLPLDKRYSGRFVTLEQTFGSANVSEESLLKLKWYHQIDTWNGYTKYLGSKNSKRVKRPGFGFDYHEFNPIAVDNQIDAAGDDLDEQKEE
jgi:hypothetical protein